MCQTARARTRRRRVLAPIVAHADDAVLSDGTSEVHTRQAEAASGRRALEVLAADAADVPGVKATAGSEVLELFARPASKALAMESLRELHGPATIVYVGDDKTDEEAFAALGPADVAVKVGEGPTLATRRLQDTGAVTVWLTAMVNALA